VLAFRGKDSLASPCHSALSSLNFRPVPFNFAPSSGQWASIVPTASSPQFLRVVRSSLRDGVPASRGNPHVLRTLRLTNFSQAPRLHSLRRNPDVPAISTGKPLHPISCRSLQFPRCVAPIAAPVLRPLRSNLLPRMAVAFRQDSDLWMGSHRRRPACVGLFCPTQDAPKN